MKPIGASSHHARRNILGGMSVSLSTIDAKLSPYAAVPTTSAGAADVVGSMHGDGEHISLASVREGAQIFFEALRDTLAK